MAKITITERDLTTALPSSVTENLVYVPGYAIKGPVNEPTVVRSVGEFTSIFGSKPYRFKSSNKDEKSYLYAIELLRNGLPVMYERISVNASQKATARINFYNSKFSGTSTQTQVNSQALTEKTDEAYTATISNEFTAGTLIIALGSVMIEDDGEGVLKVEGSPVGTVNYETREISFEIPELGTPSATYTLATPIVWDVQGTVVNGSVVWAVEGNGDTYTNAVVTLAESQATAQLVVPNLYTTTITITKESETVANANNYIDIVAKYPGAYGNEISVSFNYATTESLTGDKLYELLIKFEGLTYSNYVSLDLDSDRYIGKLAHTIVDINPVLVPEFIELDLFNVSVNDKSLFVNIVGDEITVADIISELKKTSEGSVYNKIQDKIAYNVKFITSGAYPSIDSVQDITIAKNILRCAANRGDALGLVDLDDSILPQEVLTVVSSNALYESSNTNEDIRKYGTVIYPSAQFSLSSIGTIDVMPGSFAYFKALAVSQRTNPNWFAIAGTSRGLVPDLVQLTHKVTGALSDLWQSETNFNVNPILYIRPYGYCIWGNRTLNENINGLTASSFTNIRVLVSDIKKIVVDAATKLTFEVNDDVLWNTFKSIVEPVLDQMVTGRGLRDYKLIRQATSKRATVSGLIRLVPIEAVENFDITFTLEDNLAVVE